jgi:hypothetical protein
VPLLCRAPLPEELSMVLFDFKQRATIQRPTRKVFSSVSTAQVSTTQMFSLCVYWLKLYSETQRPWAQRGLHDQDKCLETRGLKLFFYFHEILASEHRLG